MPDLGVRCCARGANCAPPAGLRAKARLLIAHQHLEERPCVRACCMHAVPGGQGMMSCGGGNTMNISWLELAMIQGPISF